MVRMLVAVLALTACGPDDETGEAVAEVRCHSLGGVPTVLSGPPKQALVAWPREHCAEKAAGPDASLAVQALRPPPR